MDASAAASSASSVQQQQRHQQQQSPPQQQPQQQQAVATSGGPQVRSRITVVCAECKRLKLKCDRKTPCGSCEKRDTIARCIYSPAAAEKVDLHSLNNRLTVVEAQLSQVGYGNARSCNHHGGSGSGLQPNDRALIAVGQSGSSLTIPLEDVTAIWLDQLDLNKDVLTPTNLTFSPSTAPYSPSQIKLERESSHLYSENGSATNCDLPAALLVPPPSIYYPLSSRTYQPSVTTDLVALLPSSRSKRNRLCNSIEEIFSINPCFIWKHFRERMDGMFRWAEDTEIIERIALESRGGGMSKADAARATFFGESASDKASPEPKPTLSFFAAAAGALAVGAQANRDQSGNGINDDSAMAVDDILPQGGASSRSATSTSSTKAKKPRTTASTQSYQTPNTDSSSRSSASPAMLFALSEQALDIFEKSNMYDLDYLVALVMHILYMLHGGKPVVDNRLYPLVGKMVNVARMMGLAMDPDEFPGKYSLFEAETRRRIWWDVFCYDLYVSDSMGHPPTIADNSFTTKMPIDVDENSFSPSSTSIPTPNADDHASRYFGLKLRMAQIVKSVKKRTFKDPLMDSPSSDSASIEEAASFEGEVTQFLTDLPLAFKLEMDADLSTLAASVSSPFSADFPERSSSSFACLIAQQCELVITGQRLILKIYLPFLRPNHTGATCGPNHQAAVGTVNAAHAIIYASRVLHAICKRPSGSQSKRPGPAIFDYYSFGQALFDAAVVCAHSVIMQPTAIWAKVALDDIVDALEVMKDPIVATGRGSLQAYVEGCVSEPVKIIEMLKKKADGVRAGSSNSPSNSGSKRKHSEVETHANHLTAGFQLPYVGAAVASAGPITGSSPGSSAPASSPPDGTQSDGTALSNSSEGSGMKRSDPEKVKAKSKKDKKAPYPMIGIRVRPSRESPAMLRHRERAHSTASTASLTETDTRMPASSSLSSVSHMSAPTLTNSHHSFGMPITQAPSPTYQSPPSADLMQPPTQQEVVHNSHNEYPSSFASADNTSLHMNLSSIHQYTIQEPSAQHGYSSRTPNQMPVYDQNQSHPYMNAPSPTSFRPGSSSQLSNGSSSFSGGPVGMSSQHQPAPFAHSHVSSAQPYEPPASNPPLAYFAPPPYQSNFDKGHGVQGPLHGLAMDNTSGMNSSLPPSPNDMMFDVKPQNGNHLQQSFGDVRGQVQEWQHDDGGSGSGAQFWQQQPGYKPYFST